MKHNFVHYEPKNDESLLEEDSKFDDEELRKPLMKVANGKLLTRNDRLCQDRLSLQKGFLENWLKEDQGLVGPKFIGDFIQFSSKLYEEKIKFNRLKISNNKEKCNFLIENAVWRILHEKDQNFKPGEGLSLSNEIIKFENNINLRSLACKMIFNFRLKGPGSINIFSRTKNFSNEESILVKIQKEGNGIDQRLFAMVGRLNDALSDYVFLKTCEIPIPRLLDENIKHNYLDLQLVIIDHGTDRVQLEVSLDNIFNYSTPLNYPNLFVPMFEEFEILLAGLKESFSSEVLIKKFCIELLDREMLTQPREVTVKTCTCSIF